MVQYGQHNLNGELHGIGREVWISSIDIGQIKEGQFVDGNLQGFGRRITYRFDKDKYISEVGNWESGEYFIGYGRRIFKHNVYEGIFEDHDDKDGGMANIKLITRK